jgi:PAS domain S-box-containing protein
MTHPDDADLTAAPHRRVPRRSTFWWVFGGAGLAVVVVVGTSVFVLWEFHRAAVENQADKMAWIIGTTGVIRIAAVGLIAMLVLRHLRARDQVLVARNAAALELQAREKLQREVARADAAIAELERAAVALGGSEQRFRDIAEVAADVIWESGVDHRFTLFAGGSNDEIHARIGIDPARVIGTTRWELAGADPEHDDHWRRHKADLDAHRPFRQFRYSVTTEQGETAYYAVNGKPVFDHEGNFAGYRGVGTNETQIVQIRSRAERAEALLRDAVESISEGFVIYDAEDRLVMCNEAFRKLYPANADMIVPGVRFEDILRSGVARGQYADAYGHEEEWLAARLKRHVDPGGPFEAQLSNGRWLMISERKMADGGIAGLRIDITAMKAAQAAVRESEERLNRAQRLARIGSDTRDLVTGKRQWSDESYRIFGLDRTTFDPDVDDFIPYVHPDDRAAIFSSRALIDRGVCPEPFEYRIQRPDGTQCQVRREFELVRDETGRAVILLGTLQDVTDLRASQARQKELERQLQHSQRLKALGTLAGGIAHDLNNTLVPILSLSKMVAARLPEGGEDREDLETITFASERARDLLQQILAFSRKQSAVMTPTDPASVVHKTVQMMRATAPGTVQIIERIEELPQIMADAGQLQQVIVNLVTNGIQAIGKGGGQVTVGVATAAPEIAGDIGPAVALTVSDTGRGMDAATLERIFEPFYTTKRVGEGTGLGLSVAHGIVSEHGGRIDVASAPGKGTVFTVVVPMMQPSQTWGPEVQARARGDAVAALA